MNSKVPAITANEFSQYSFHQNKKHWKKTKFFEKKFKILYKIKYVVYNISQKSISFSSFNFYFWLIEQFQVYFMNGKGRC